jgi:hypothetical protein
MFRQPLPTEAPAKAAAATPARLTFDASPF